MRVAVPPPRPILVFDGDCDFCRLWIARWRERTGDRVGYLPFQDPRVEEQFPELDRARCARSVQFIDAAGDVTEGAAAVFGALALSPAGRGPQWLYRNVPGIAPVTEWAYRLVADHRPFFSVLARILVGRPTERPTHHLTRWLFLRALGLIYLATFLSLGTQIVGLVGAHGIQPIRELLPAAFEHNGFGAWWQFPTLCWISTSDGFLRLLCAGGAVLAILLVLDFAPAITLFLLWGFSLSASVAGDVFLGYQWDALLLETGSLAILLGPGRLLPNWLATRLGKPPVADPPPSWIAIWLLRWLIFRLMLSSAVVKLASNDPSWSGLTALTFHYETQPLPTWIGWYAHQLPAVFHQFSCGVMFAIEFGAAALVFAPRRPRFLGAAAIAFLMLLISATGNYCFFNLLTLVLCIPLLDDTAVRRFFPRRMREPVRAKRPPRWRAWLLSAAAVVVLLVTVVQQFKVCRIRIQWPRPIYQAHLHALIDLMPLRSLNTYGLFAVMTTTRSEIVLEGSNDGQRWEAYEFNDKPGNPSRRPRFVAPHQPRLDWQMWFEALRAGRGQPSPWFLAFCARLLEGSPKVLALLGHNPFPDAPPRYLRAVVYEYHFTDLKTRRLTGDWWRRVPRGLYTPVLSLQPRPTSP